MQKQIHKSNCDKYTLEIESIETKPGCWNYTRGIVKKENSIIRTINRNYHSFPFLFISNHPSGHDYLICGESYMGQNVLELDTGEYFSLPKDKYGFCWRKFYLDDKSKILTVQGCYWASSEEFKFFNFSNPANGWPEIKIFDQDGKFSYVDYDIVPPKINEDNTITCYQSKDEYDDDVIEQDDPELPIIAKMLYKIENNILIFKSEWVSEEEKNKREEQLKAEKEYKEWRDNYEKTDALFLLHNSCIDLYKFNYQDYHFMGQTYDNWCDFWKGDEKIIYRRLCYKSYGYTIDLEWAHLSGPILINVFKNGNFDHKKWFEHSGQGMNDAFDYANNILKKQSKLEKLKIKVIEIYYKYFKFA